MGFKTSPYDPCIAYRMVKGTQQIVCWYLENLKLSHVSYKVNIQVINQLKNIYGKDMTIKPGKVHKYLGMHLDFRLKGKPRVGMMEYIKESVSIRTETINVPVKTPAG